MLQDLQWDGCRKETDYYEKSYGSRRNSNFRDKELIEVATELADRVIAQLGNKELEKAAVTVAEGVREYSTGKRGR